MNKISSIKPHVLLCLILLLAAVARTYHITYPLNDMHSFRQTQTAGLIRDYYRQGIDLFYPTLITLGDPGYVILEFPLYQALAAFFYRIFSPDIIYARILSILCGLLSIVFVYRLTARFLDERSALFASFFYAFMPLSIFFQRVPMPDPFVILLSLIMLDFTIEGINNKNNFLLAGGILAGSLGLVIKSPYVAPLYLPVMYAIYKPHEKWRSFLHVRVLCSFFIPCALMMLWQSHANSINETFFSVPSYPFKELYDKVMVKLHPVNTWYFGTIGQRMEFKNYFTVLERIYLQILSLAGVFYLLPGFFQVVKKKAAFFFLWLFSILLSIMIFFNLNVVHNYYQLPLTPILAIFCGAGASYLVGIFRRRTTAVSLAAVLTISFIYMHYQTAADFFREENNYLEVGSYIDDHTDKNAMLATSPPDQDYWYPIIMYYADRHGFNLAHGRLNEDMIEYLRDRRVKYLALIDYMGMDNLINEAICPYQIVSENNRVAIYDISHINRRCAKKLSSVSDASAPVIFFDFENGIKGWHSLGRVHIAQDKSRQYGGRTSLKITGTGQADSWSFGQSGKFRISPGRHYRFTGWMLIDSISDETSFFKCELWDGEQWLKNYVSNEYNIRKERQWRELKAEFVAPEGDNIALRVAVEKRPFEKEVEAVIYIDDIKLETIE